MKLFCVVVGGRGSAFPVDINSDQSVGDLKKAIKKEKKNKFKNVDADDLVLFLAKKDKGKGAWLTGADVATVRDDIVSQTYKLMESTLLLKNPENFGESFQTCEGHVHVLVEVPVELSTLHEPRYRQLFVDGVDVRVTESMRLDPPPLVRFWRAFQEIPTEFKKDAVITLPGGTFLLGDPTLGSRIYIRHCYPKLWDVCWEMIHDEVMKTPHLVILGNPGIGKTYFGYVILLVLARLGKTVVYESRASKQRFLLSRDMVVEGSQQDFIDILKQTTTYYIVDGVEPTYFPAKTILLTSPRRSVWFEFNKTNCQACYMPVWSRYEIFKCRELMYSDIPESVVQDCFRRWGGVARYVLRFATNNWQQISLEKAMDSVNLDWLVDACGKLDADPEQVSHRLLHYRVTKDFTTDYFVFASQYVLDEIYRRLYNKNKQKLLEFIDASDGVGAAAVLRGHLFEGYVHSVLPRGGTFQIRRLVDDSKTHNGTGEAHDGGVPNANNNSTGGFWSEGRLRPRRKGKDKGDSNAMDVDSDVSMEEPDSSSGGSSYDEDEQVSGDLSNSVIPNIASIGTDVTTITLPERRTVVFNNAYGLEAGDPTSYLRPAAKNYKSVDAIMKPNVMFQVTCAKEHPCKQAGLYDVLKLLKNPEAPALVFVLPADRFLGFGYQKYHNAKDEATEESKYLNVRKIRQFAMEVKTCVGADEDTC